MADPAPTNPPLRLGVLGSGKGSNFRAIAEAIARGDTVSTISEDELPDDVASPLAAKDGSDDARSAGAGGAGGSSGVADDAVSTVSSVVAGVEDLSVTTNGYLLERDAERLVRAGINRFNVSIDSLQRDRFFEMTRRDALLALGLGAIGYGLQAGGYFAALERLDASLLALLIYNYPVTVTVAAVALGREPASRRTAAVLRRTGEALLVATPRPPR